MSKYGKIYVNFESGSEDCTAQENDFITTTEANVIPEEPENWDSVLGYELLDTIVEAGKKMAREMGFPSLVENSLYNIYWQRFDDFSKPGDYYDDKFLLVVIYKDKKFYTVVDRWNKYKKSFDCYGTDVIYWAEMPEPPIQI